MSASQPRHNAGEVFNSRAADVFVELRHRLNDEFCLPHMDGLERWSEYVVQWTREQKRRITEIEAVIREVEWADEASYGNGSRENCPSCKMSKRSGHAPDCRIAAVLKTECGNEATR